MLDGNIGSDNGSDNGSDKGSDANQDVPFPFRPFTREELDAIESRIRDEKVRKKTNSDSESDAEDEELLPDYRLENGMPLPRHLELIFPEELTLIPVVDIDEYYHNKRTFIVIDVNRDLLRFSATNALWLFSPFHTIRRVAIYIYLHPVSCTATMCVVMFNCLLMAVRKNRSVEASESLFTAVYTFEFFIKIVTLGFLLEPFTYLRDRWNWIDIVVLALEYLPTGVDMSSLRALRVLRALKTINVLPGLKCIVEAVVESAKNLRDVIILTFFVLWMLALLGLQIYMGALTQKCIKTISHELIKNMTNEEVQEYRQNSSNWYMQTEEDKIVPQVCGNTSWTTKCPDGYSCYGGYGKNPDYGYTNFDSFGWAMLSAFRIMMQDSWDRLCRLIIRAMGPWHMFYFVLIIFLGSSFLLNLILAIIDLSFSELLDRAMLEEEEEAENQAEDNNVTNENEGNDKIHKIVPEENRLFERGASADIIRNENAAAGCSSDCPQWRSDEESKQAYIAQRLLGFEANSPCRRDVTPITTQQANLECHVIEKDGQSEPSPGVPTDNPVEAKGTSKWRWKTLKERFRPSCMALIDTFCVWECCEFWIKFQKIVHLFVYDAFVELFIAVCIIINTVFLAMDHYGIDEDLNTFLEEGNFVLAIIFAIEVGLKIIALSPKHFFKEKWNIFEFFTAGNSIVDQLFGLVKYLPILRSLRLLRIFKLAKSWPTLNLLLTIMAKCLLSLGSLCFLLVIIIFIFTVMGMELFGDEYELNKHKFPHGEMPRWHYNDFMHSFLIVFGVLCGEWIESLWNCMLVSGYTCLPYFLAIVLIGNTLLFNLFIAVLMSAFDSSSITEVEDDYEMTVALNRIKRFGAFLMRCTRRIRGAKIVHPKIDLENEVNAIKSSAKSEVSRTSLKALLDDFSEENESAKQGQSNINTPILEDEIYDLNPENNAEKTQHQLYANEGEEMELNQVHQFGNYEETGSSNKDIEKPEDDNEISIPNTDSREDAVKDQKVLEHKNDSYKAVVETSPSKHSSNAEIDASENEIQNKYKLSEEDLPHKDPAKYEENEDTSKPNGRDKAQEKIKEITYTIKEKEQQEAKEFECNDNTDLYDPDIGYHCITWCPRKHGSLCGKWSKAGSIALTIFDHPFHNYFVVIWIIISSLALTTEDKNIDDRPFLRDNIKYFDLVFEAVFMADIILAWLALGCKTYFINPWFWLDFIIHVFSVISIIGTLFEVGNISFIRCLRALRPLRLLYRIPGLRVLVTSLAQAIPAIMNVVLVCLIIWLIFSIMGVTLFAGKFASCIDQDDQKLDYQIVPNKTVCEILNYTWENSKINFDHVGEGYLALFQVATFGGWVDVMNNAIDSREEEDLQPVKEYGIYKCLYFVFIIIFGTFFILNLFTTAIIETVAARKRSVYGYKIENLSEDQLAYKEAMIKLSYRKPPKPIFKPKWKPQVIVFNIISDEKFDLLIIILVGINIAFMALDQYDMSDNLYKILKFTNLIFVAVFTIECLMKIFALQWYYFKQLWNVFDFIIVALAILDILLVEYTGEGFASPILLRIVKGVRVIKLLRFVKSTRGVGILLATLIVSLPSLLNTLFFHFIVMFVYAIFGIHFFKNLELGGAFDENFNFASFYPSINLLFQLSTAAGWDEVFEIITDDEKCSEPSLDDGCANSTVALVYLISYLIITFLIIINMYIAVIVENYDKVTEEAIRGLNDDDYDSFFDTWKKYDPNATGYISFHDLSDFLDELESPWSMSKPNQIKIAIMDINIYVGERIFYADIVNALILEYFSYQEREVVNNMKPKPQNDLVSSTLKRPRQDYCARVIQRAWHQYRVKSKEDISTTVVQEYYNSIMQELEQVLTGKLPRKNFSHPTGKSNGSTRR